MGKAILILVAFSCILLAALPITDVVADEVIENKCTEDQSQEKDKSCAHNFLEKITQSSANCSVELKKYKECFKNFTLGKCFGDYLRTHPDMKKPMGRMADMKSKIHSFARMICGIFDGPMNTTGIPDKVKHLLKCKPEFHVEARSCAKTFYDKYVANRNSTDLCKSYMKAKMCHMDLMKQHCTHKRPPPRDHFNPFCPNKKDPPHPKGGAEKAYTGSILTFMSLASYLFL